jgi:20S proteasome subunit alpha 6
VSKLAKMFRNQQYDMDCITWSPGGRILQVEYAMEAVKQGTPVLGLRSKTHVVLASFKRSQSELAEHQQKIFKIDNHMCIGIAGLTADARVLAEYMRDECLNHKYIYDAPMNVGRLVSQIGDKSQQQTQNSSKRPYGVGLLVAGVDEKGPHIYETCPSGNYFEYHAMAIGGRSTSAKTYMERHFESFPDADLETLLQYGVEAMNKTTASDTPLTVKNTQVVVIGVSDGYKTLSDEELQKYIDKLEKKDPADDVAMDDAPAAAAPAGDAPAPMDTQ